MVNIPTAARAAWWPCPVVGTVWLSLKVIGVSTLPSCSVLFRVSSVDFDTIVTVTISVSCGIITKTTTLRAKKRFTARAISAAKGMFLRGLCRGGLSSSSRLSTSSFFGRLTKYTSISSISSPSPTFRSGSASSCPLKLCKNCSISSLSLWSCCMVPSPFCSGGIASPFTSKLHRNIFIWTGGAELSIVIEKDKMVICHVDDHVEASIPVYVLETKRHDCQVLFSDKSGHKIDFGFTCVSPWKLDNLYMVVIVDGDKVSRMICRVAVTDYHIRLECAGSAIVYIVLGEVPPTDDHCSKYP